jgi:hypothetical protein
VRQLSDVFDLGVLTDAIPPELVDEVIDQMGCREQRTRKLPARVVMYFVLGMCVFSAADGFCPPGYRTVMRTLVHRWKNILPGCTVVSSSALTQARQRLGAKPLQELFDRVRGATGAVTEWSHAFGLRLVAWDGTTVDVPDSPANAHDFGYQGCTKNRTAPAASAPAPRAEPVPSAPPGATQRGGAATGANPSVRMITLVECGTHAVIDAVFDGVANASEQVLATRLIASLQPGTLLLADRNFAGHTLWGLAAGTGAELLWRVRKNIQLPPEKNLPDGSFLAIMPDPTQTKRLASLRYQGRPATTQHGHLIRVIEYDVTITTSDGQTRVESFRLITTLLDHQLAPAEDIAALYPQRWESETSNSFFKPRLIGADVTLRSHTPDGVAQEIYAFLVIYQALCGLRTEASTTASLDPDRISFLVTIRAVRAAITNQVHPTHNPTRQDLIAELINEKLGPRRQRSSPRQRIPHPSKYPSKRRDRPRPSTKAHHQIQLRHATI